MDLGRLHLSRIVDCCGTGGEKGTTWHVCDGLIGIIRAAGLPEWDALKRLDERGLQHHYYDHISSIWDFKGLLKYIT